MCYDIRMEKNGEKMRLGLLSGGGWIYWLMERGKQLLFLVPLLGIGLYFMVKNTHVKTGREADYLSASVTFDEWEKSSDSQDGKLDKLQQLMCKHPELKVRYEDRIVHKLISMGEFDRAMPFATQALARVEDLAPQWVDFGRTTLLIGKKEYGKALDETLRLKKRLDESSSLAEVSLLRGFTQLRLATLYQKLGNVQEELAVWCDFERAAEGKGSLNKETFERLRSHFTERNVDLLDYIRHRKVELKRY